MSGNVRGRIAGSHLNVTVNWDNGQTGAYTGDAGGDETVSGNTSGVAFALDQRFVCLNNSPMF